MNTVSIQGLGVGPLYLRFEARNTQHYYIFAPRAFVIPETGMLTVAEKPEEKAMFDLIGAIRRHGIFGVTKVCGFSSDRLLSEVMGRLAAWDKRRAPERQSPPQSTG